MSETETSQQTHLLLHEHSTRCERCGVLVKGWDTASPPPSTCYGGPPSGDEAARLYLKVRAAEQQILQIAMQVGITDTDEAATLPEMIAQKIRGLTDDSDDRVYYAGLTNGFKDAGNLVMSRAHQEFTDTNDKTALMLRKLAFEILEKGAEAHHRKDELSL